MAAQPSLALRPLAARFEGPRGGGGVIMLDISNVHLLSYSPLDGSIDILDDVLVVLGDVVLDVDNDKCPVVHHSSMMKLRG